VLTDLADLRGVRISAESGESEPGLVLAADLVESNQIDFDLRPGSGRRPDRSFMSSSACGVCGATTVEALSLDFPILEPGLSVQAEVLPGLAVSLRERQRIFEATGGLHAAGLFDAEGNLMTLREDIGRHNAVDKVVGRALLDGGLPASDSILAVSGRAGYEVVQKAIAAGIPILVAVGAPSSLAVATASRFKLTLVGFLRGDRFNVYSAPERLDG
jgi:FdhD protein